MVKKDIARAPILEAFRQNEDCPICVIWANAEARYLHYLETNEMTMNPAFRQKVVDARGFCNRHMHELYKIAFSGETENGLGYAIYAKDVVTSLEGVVRGAKTKLAAKGAKSRSTFMRRGGHSLDGSGDVSSLRGALRGKSNCPVCSSTAESDEQTVSLFLRMLHDDPEFVTVFEASMGVCTPHFASALDLLQRSRTDVSRTTKVLLGVELRRLEGLRRHLEERIRKYGYDSRGEKITREEARSQEDAMKMITGAEGFDLPARNA